MYYVYNMLYCTILTIKDQNKISQVTNYLFISYGINSIYKNNSVYVTYHSYQYTKLKQRNNF